MTQDNDDTLTELGTTNLKDFITFRVARVNARLNSQATQILSKHAGLSLVQWRMIISIADQGTTTSNQICRSTAMDKGLVSRKLKDLVKDGFVTSETNDADHRQNMLSLTPKGQAVHDKTLPIMRRRQAYLLAQLDEEEARVLASALSKIDRAAEVMDF